MDLTPELLRTVEFNDARKGGYDHDEVDEFLDRAAADLARQHERIRDLETRVGEAERRAEEAAAQAKDTSDSDETLRRTLVLAQRTADAAIKEAEEDSARIVGEARQKADGMIASAEEQVRRDVGATRDRLQSEIRELEGRRSDLHERITGLSSHLDAERDRIGTQLDELRESLRADSMAVRGLDADEPALFDPEDAPGSSEPTIDLVESDSGDDDGESATDPDPVDRADDAPSLDTDDAGEDLSELPPPPEDWSSADDAADADAADDDAAEDHVVSDDVDDGGPPTEATPVVEVGSDVGSTHLDELKRAVSDGPNSEEGDDDAAMAAFFDQDDDAEPSRRFGRRR